MPGIPAAFFSLSQTQRRQAHRYRRWALEAKALGKIERFEEYKQASDKSWRNAKGNYHLAKTWGVAA